MVILDALSHDNHTLPWKRMTLGGRQLPATQQVQACLPMDLRTCEDLQVRRADQTLVLYSSHSSSAASHRPHEGLCLSSSHLCIDQRRSTTLNAQAAEAAPLTYVAQACRVQDAECIRCDLLQRLVAAGRTDPNQLQSRAVACQHYGQRVVVSGITVEPAWLGH